MKGLSCFLTFLIVMGGCSTTSKDILPPHASTLPPEYNISSDKDKASVDLLLQNLILPDTGESTHWWVAYKRARLWAEEKPELSCPLFTKLSRDQRFPIHRLAFLRSFEVCDKVQGRPGEKSPELVAENFDPWFENLILEVQLQRAQRLGDKKALLFASWEKSKLNLPRDQKVEHTLKALRLAKKLKLKKEKAKLLARFYRLAPRHQPRPRRRDYFKVAYDFRRVREFDKARKYYRKIIFHKKTMGDDKVRAYKGLAATYKVENNKAKYLKALGELGRYTTKLLGRAKNKKWAARLFKSTHLSLARAQWTEGQVTNAKKTLTHVTQKAGRYIGLDEVYWIRGRMMEEQHKYEAAIWWFKKAIGEKGVSKKFKEKLQWYVAWNLRKLKRYEEAIKTLAKIRDESTETFERAKFAFWLAKSYADLGQEKSARSEYEELIEDDALGYYGVLAHRELKKSYTTQRVHRQIASEAVPSDLKKWVNQGYIEWLISLGENEVARDYLDHAAKAYIKSKGQNESSWVALYRYYARAGNYIALFQQLNYLPREQRQRIVRTHPHLIFPKPYFEHVAESAQRFGVSTEFVYSIMRQESAFNPRARSPMDAFGLMQMLPRVARSTAKQIALPVKRPEDLYQPHVSVALGSAHLRELWDKYNGEFIPAVASYNASGKAIRNWIRTRYKGNSLEFIEDIPYEETKGYVKLVLRNLIFYKTLNYPDQEVSFPEWTLKISAHES